MALTGTRTFVGFGLGAIQSGLFLSEAFRSGNFCRMVAAEIVPEVVAAIRGAGGQLCVNIAYQDHIEPEQIGRIEIENPACAPDRQRVIDAIAEAEEIASAIPSVEMYSSENEASLERILAAGLRQKIASGGPRAVVYSAENHNQAAEILEGLVLKEIPPAMRLEMRQRVQFLNTVIGKMSQVVIGRDVIAERGLTRMAPGIERAVLVEAYNKIFIDAIRLGEPFQRGISIFEEKENLIPFQEAKLYGHNAIHALGGYIGQFAGARLAADLKEMPGMMACLHTAFTEECGRSLIKKYGGSDPLFTPQGWEHYALDLLDRMMNPLLMDSIERVTRDTPRKLGWDDRLIGTMRLAIAQEVEPTRFAFGTAAALAALDASTLENESSVERNLNSIWADVSCTSDEKRHLAAMIQDAMPKLKAWRDGGYPNIETFIRNY